MTKKHGAHTTTTTDDKEKGSGKKGSVERDPVAEQIKLLEKEAKKAEEDGDKALANYLKAQRLDIIRTQTEAVKANLAKGLAETAVQAEVAQKRLQYELKEEDIKAELQNISKDKRLQEELTRGMSPEEKKKVLDALKNPEVKQAVEEGVSNRLVEWFRGAGPAAVAGMSASIAAKVGLRCLLLGAGASFWSIMAVGTASGGVVEGIRAYLKQTKKVTDLGDVFLRLESKSVPTLEKALIITELQKLQKQAQIDKNDPYYQYFTTSLINAQRLVETEYSGVTAKDDKAKIEYLLNLGQITKDKQPDKTLKKGVNGLLKKVNKTFTTRRQWGIDAFSGLKGKNNKERLQALKESEELRAITRGAVTGAIFGAGGALLGVGLEQVGDWVGQGFAATKARLAEIYATSKTEAALSAAGGHVEDTMKLAAGSNPWETTKDFLVAHGMAHPTDAQVLEADKIIAQASGIGVPEWGVAGAHLHTELPPGFELHGFDQVAQHFHLAGGASGGSTFDALAAEWDKLPSLGAGETPHEVVSEVFWPYYAAAAIGEEVLLNKVKTGWETQDRLNGALETTTKRAKYESVRAEKLAMLQDEFRIQADMINEGMKSHATAFDVYKGVNVDIDIHAFDDTHFDQMSQVWQDMMTGVPGHAFNRIEDVIYQTVGELENYQTKNFKKKFKIVPGSGDIYLSGNVLEIPLGVNPIDLKRQLESAFNTRERQEKWEDVEATVERWNEALREGKPASDRPQFEISQDLNPVLFTQELEDKLEFLGKKLLELVHFGDNETKLAGMKFEVTTEDPTGLVFQKATGVGEVFFAPLDFDTEGELGGQLIAALERGGFDIEVPGNETAAEKAAKENALRQEVQLTIDQLNAKLTGMELPGMRPKLFADPGYGTVTLENLRTHRDKIKAVADELDMLVHHSDDNAALLAKSEFYLLDSHASDKVTTIDKLGSGKQIYLVPLDLEIDKLIQSLHETLKRDLKVEIPPQNRKAETKAEKESKDRSEKIIKDLNAVWRAGEPALDRPAFVPTGDSSPEKIIEQEKLLAAVTKRVLDIIEHDKNNTKKFKGKGVTFNLVDHLALSEVAFQGAGNFVIPLDGLKDDILDSLDDRLETYLGVELPDREDDDEDDTTPPVPAPAPIAPAPAPVPTTPAPVTPTPTPTAPAPSVTPPVTPAPAPGATGLTPGELLNNRLESTFEDYTDRLKDLGLSNFTKVGFEAARIHTEADKQALLNHEGVKRSIEWLEQFFSDPAHEALKSVLHEVNFVPLDPGGSTDIKKLSKDSVGNEYGKLNIPFEQAGGNEDAFKARLEKALKAKVYDDKLYTVFSAGKRAHAPGLEDLDTMRDLRDSIRNYPTESYFALIKLYDTITDRDLKRNMGDVLLNYDSLDWRFDGKEDRRAELYTIVATLRRAYSNTHVEFADSFTDSSLSVENKVASLQRLGQAFATHTLRANELSELVLLGENAANFVVDPARKSLTVKARANQADMDARVEEYVTAIRGGGGGAAAAGAPAAAPGVASSPGGVSPSITTPGATRPGVLSPEQRAARSQAEIAADIAALIDNKQETSRLLNDQYDSATDEEKRKILNKVEEVYMKLSPVLIRELYALFGEGLSFGGIRNRANESTVLLKNLDIVDGQPDNVDELVGFIRDAVEQRREKVKQDLKTAAPEFYSKLQDSIETDPLLNRAVRSHVYKSFAEAIKVFKRDQEGLIDVLEALDLDVFKESGVDFRASPNISIINVESLSGKLIVSLGEKNDFSVSYFVANLKSVLELL